LHRICRLRTQVTNRGEDVAYESQSWETTDRDHILKCSGPVHAFKAVVACHNPLRLGSPSSSSRGWAIIGVLLYIILDVELIGPLFLPMPRIDSITASRAITSEDVVSFGGILSGEDIATDWRALARGLKTHSVPLFRHRLHGPSRAGSHFIFQVLETDLKWSYSYAPFVCDSPL
jgi:hypothetical protein